MLISILLLLIPAAYQVLAIIAGIRHFVLRRSLRNEADFTPPVSILKPLRGLDPNTYEAFRSQVEQDYPEFEVLFGVARADDPAVAYVEKLQGEYPAANIRLTIGAPETPNGKVGVMMALAEQAQHPIWVVNDSDIRVCPDYLRSVVAPLAENRIGVVTCPYRALAHNFPAAWEAFGVAIDFMPSTLVAPLVGVREFGLGSTLAFRAADLKAAGGFGGFQDYIADDYQLAKRITAQGKQALLSAYIVETSFGDDTWQGIWQHQLRWARTIRASKGKGYAGLPITQAGLWIGALLAAGRFELAGMLFLLRTVAGFVTGGLVLGTKSGYWLCWIAPIWDWYAFAVWLASYRNRKVQWRDRALTVDREGRIR